MPILIVFSGLPATGKSSIARELARETGAVWLRIDSIEQAILASGVAAGIEDAGYRAAYAVADDNLRLGRDVIGDSVNGWPVTRNAWRDVGLRAGARILEVEIICSDIDEHRRRVETRRNEIPGHVLPDWQAVIERDFEPWDRERLIVDTADNSIEDSLTLVRSALATVRNEFFEITLLNKKPQFIEACAAWDFAEWGCHMRNGSLAQAMDNFRRASENEQLPRVWVASHEGKPIGMVMLTKDDHPDHRQLSPWLSSLYVHPEFRRKGIAETLCRYVALEATELGFGRIYLYTATAERLCRRMGWEPIGVVAGPTGHDETLMVLSCS